MQLSPTFLAQRAISWKTIFPRPRVEGTWFQEDSSALHLSCTLFLLLLHQLHPKSSGIRSGWLGTPAEGSRGEWKQAAQRLGRRGGIAGCGDGRRTMSKGKWNAATAESEKGGGQLRKAKRITGASGGPGLSGSITSYPPPPRPPAPAKAYTPHQYLWAGFGFPFFLMLFAVVSLKCNRPRVTLVTWSASRLILKQTAKIQRDCKRT